MKYYNKLLSSLRRAVPVEETWRNLLLQRRLLCLACAPASVGFAPEGHPHIACHCFHSYSINWSQLFFSPTSIGVHFQPRSSINTILHQGSSFNLVADVRKVTVERRNSWNLHRFSNRDHWCWLSRCEPCPHTSSAHKFLIRSEEYKSRRTAFNVYKR